MLSKRSKTLSGVQASRFFMLLAHALGGTHAVSAAHAAPQ